MQRILTLAFTLLLIAACATPSGPPPVASGELTNAADGTRIAIKRGGELKVVLDANITTGYQWQSPTSGSPVMSIIGAPIYVGKAADSHFVGGGGTNIFRFRADSPGQVVLQFDYRRPWETGVPPAKTLRYDVVVP
jgi:inhibitor of cysteine peptidase